MQYQDYYQTLGIARGASQDEVKRAYRKLARKYHPDISKEPDAEARFKDVGEAYEVRTSVHLRTGARISNSAGGVPPATGVPSAISSSRCSVVPA